MGWIEPLEGSIVPDTVAFDVEDPEAPLESRLRSLVFSVAFQYVVAWLALVYMALSFGTFVLGKAKGIR